MKRTAGFLLTVLAVCLALPAAMDAAAGERSYETEVINSISIGDISISLEEYELSDDGERKDERGIRSVLPGESLVRAVRVTNRANPAWIRVSFTYCEDEGMPDIPPPYITVTDVRWRECGGYYYLTSPLETGEQAFLQYELSIPAFWGSEAAGMDFGIDVMAEAVQEANFFPDFAADDPWFGTLTEACVHTSHSVPALLRYDEFSVSFEGGAEGLVRLGDDLFGNLGALMPGDEGGGSITLRNAYTDPVTLYFRTEGIDEGALADEASLMISDGAEVIYSGKLSESRGEIPVAILSPQEEKELIYSVFIPPECGNSYALTEAADKWIFRAALNVEEDTVKHISSGARSHYGSGAGGPGAVIETAPGPPAELIPVIREMPQTGEKNSMLTAVTFMALSAMILALIFLCRRTKPAEGGVR